MKKKINRKGIIIATVSIITVILITIAIIISLQCMKNKRISDFNCELDIEDELEKIVKANIESEEKLKDEDFLNLVKKHKDENIVGTIEIPKIKYQGFVYDGTTLKTLAKGIGHFESSSYLNGNVCLAGHNTINQWAKLKNVKKGDVIKYKSFLGYKEYVVDGIFEIQENDLSKLADTEENRITLITCIRNKPNLRLCVQGIEKN